MSEDRTGAVSGLMRQFLEWVGERPRSYGEVMEAWRTSCPRLSVWEDAADAGLVRSVRGKRMRESSVELTERGRAELG